MVCGNKVQGKVTAEAAIRDEKYSGPRHTKREKKTINISAASLDTHGNVFKNHFDLSHALVCVRLRCQMAGYSLTLYPLFRYHHPQLQPHIRGEKEKAVIIALR